MIKAVRHAEGRGERRPASRAACTPVRLRHASRLPLYRPGFTLVELLTVIAIVAVLAGMLLPAIGAARDRARRAAVSTEVRNIEMAMNTYFQDYAVYPWDDYPAEGTGDRERRAGQALVRYLDPELAGEEGSVYFEFDSRRLMDTEIDGDGGDGFVFLNLFAGESYYRFRNNYDRGRFDSYDRPGWRVSYANRNSVDVWTADAHGKDFVDRNKDSDWASSPGTDRYPTRDNLRGVDDPAAWLHTIGNW